MRGSISQPWDHELNQNQDHLLNLLSHPGAPRVDFSKVTTYLTSQDFQIVLVLFSFLFFFLFFNIFERFYLFIWLIEREAASERGNTSRGSGEEEAGSQQRSLMWGSIPRLWDHALCRRQTLKCCATQVPPSLCLLILMSVLDTGCTAHMQNV